MVRYGVDAFSQRILEPESPWPLLRTASSVEPEMNDAALERRRQVEALAEDLGPIAFAVALRMLGDRESASDALQDAYVQAFRGMRRYRGEATLKTWFLTIVVNCCRRHRRWWRRWTAIASKVEAVADGAENSGAAVGDPALRQRLDAAIARLPHRQRAAFVLRYGQDLTIEEIAEVMGCATGTVKATLHKAVAKLRVELAEAVERGTS